MTAPTPGQRAYEALHASLLARNPDHEYVPWTELDELTRHADGWYRADLEAAAQAVLNDAFPGLREQVRLARQDRDQLRKHVLDLAAGLENSAAATAPSKKSGIESDLAAKLRQAAEPPS